MATALFSLALNISALDNFAMTGELSLTGQVLKIGGVKEKLIAAKRSGVKTIIFPESNKGDYDELASYIKEGVDAHFVRTFDEVVKIVFPGLLAK